MQTLVGGPSHPRIHLGQTIDDAQQLLRGGHLALIADLGSDLWLQVLSSGGGICLTDEQRAEMLDQIAKQLAQVFTSLTGFVDEMQGPDGIAFQNMLRHLGDGLHGGEAEDLQHIRLTDFITTKRHELVQHGLGITHPTISPLADGKGGLFVEIHAFQIGDVEQMFGDDRQRDAAQVKALTTADDRRQDLVRLRGGEDEFHMRRRLFQSLQQGVKRSCREHVDLIDVVDFIATLRRRVFDAFTQVTHLIDAVVTGAVDLHHI